MRDYPPYEEMKAFLEANGWEQSWSDDNWVRSDAYNKEANTGIPTKGAYDRAKGRGGDHPKNRLYTYR